MRNLLSANFARLWRSRLFWIVEAGVGCSCVLSVEGQYGERLSVREWEQLFL